MGECGFVVSKHELYAFKQYFDVSIKLTSSLILSMRIKDEVRYSFTMTSNEAMLEILKDFKAITEDHIMLGEDMVLNIDCFLLENLVKRMELILAFCKQKEYEKAEGMESIRKICSEGIENVEILSTIFKRMKLALYMHSSYSA